MQASTIQPVSEAEPVLQKRLERLVQGLRVLPRGEGIVLQGRTRSYYDKQLAQHIAMQVTGARVLTNQIQVG